MVVNTLKSVAVRLALIEAALAEVKVGTHLAVEARPLYGSHAAAFTTAEEGEGRIKMCP